MRWFIGCMAVMFVTVTPASAVMLERGDLYTTAELEKDAVRLRIAALKIYEKIIRSYLTNEEKTIGGDVKWEFPLPKSNDILLNFYSIPKRGSIVLPIISLKAFEDTTTAYAWLYYNKKNLSNIDLYYTMLRYRDRKDFPGGKLPPILKALGIPKDALKDKRVDGLSLNLRNEAFAFIIAHELGHIWFRHTSTEGLSMADVRGGEIEADNFAFDVLSRTKTVPLGAVLFFQAQIYSHTHRAEFPTRKEWEIFQRTAMSHPLSADRLATFASYIEEKASRLRPGENMLWRYVGLMLRKFLPTMEDTELARCVIKVAKKADLSILHPQPTMNRAAYLRICRGL